jgi:hypothetical protein
VTARNARVVCSIASSRSKLRALAPVLLGVASTAGCNAILGQELGQVVDLADASTQDSSIVPDAPSGDDPSDDAFDGSSDNCTRIGQSCLDGDASLPACDGSAFDAATGGFSPWYPVGSARLPGGARVTGVSPLAGEVEFFAVDRTGTVVFAEATAPFGAGAWQPTWMPVTSDPTTFPPGATVSAVVRGAGRVDLFAVRGDGAVVTTTNGLSGNKWEAVGGPSPTFAPQHVGVVTPQVPTVHVLAASGGAIYESTQSSEAGPYSAWQAVGLPDAAAFPSDTSVAVVASNPVTIDAVARGNDGRIYRATRVLSPTDTGWTAWAALGNVLLSNSTMVTAASHAPTELDVFALNPGGTPSAILHNDDWPDGGWVGWFTLGGTALAGSRVVALSSMDLYVIDPSGEVMTRPFDQQSSMWAPGWVPISPCGAVVAASSIEAVRGVGTATELAAVDATGQMFVADRASSP